MLIWHCWLLSSCECSVPETLVRSVKKETWRWMTILLLICDAALHRNLWAQEHHPGNKLEDGEGQQRLSGTGRSLLLPDAPRLSAPHWSAQMSSSLVGLPWPLVALNTWRRPRTPQGHRQVVSQCKHPPWQLSFRNQPRPWTQRGETPGLLFRRRSIIINNLAHGKTVYRIFIASFFVRQMLFTCLFKFKFCYRTKIKYIGRRRWIVSCCSRLSVGFF